MQFPPLFLEFSVSLLFLLGELGARLRDTNTSLLGVSWAIGSTVSFLVTAGP